MMKPHRVCDFIQITPPKKPKEAEEYSVSHHEIITKMKKMFRNSWFKHQMPVNYISFSKAVGNKDHHRMHDLITAKYINPQNELIKKCTRLTKMIEKREVVFIERAGHVFLRPPEFCHHIPKYCLMESWSLFARCQTCTDNKFLSVLNGDAEMVACFNCIPPSQFSAIGVKLSKRKLIEEAIIKLGIVYVPEKAPLQRRKPGDPRKVKTIAFKGFDSEEAKRKRRLAEIRVRRKAMVKTLNG